MTVTITPDKIQVTNESDEVTFDTDNRLFFATDFVTGTLTIPQRSNNTIAVYNHTLDACDVAADRVIGIIKLGISGINAGIPGYGWFNAGGTYLHFLDGRDGFHFSDHGNIDRMSAYTFYCEGGNLKCYETIMLNNLTSQGTVGLTQNAFSLHYRIWCGTFDQ